MDKQTLTVTAPIKQALISASLILLAISFCVQAFAEDSSARQEVTNFHARPVLGLNADASGSLTIKDGLLRFENNKQQVTLVSLASIEGAVLSEQSKQVGGIPMTLGKAAVPFGGGRVVSLFSHKKYDDVAIIYRDDDGGVHGVIFELPAGEGLQLQKLIFSHGVPAGSQVSGGGRTDQEVGRGNN